MKSYQIRIYNLFYLLFSPIICSVNSVPLWLVNKKGVVNPDLVSGDNRKAKHHGFLRRGFLKGAAIGAAAVTGADLLKGKAEATEDAYYPATTSPSAEFDFTQKSGALQPDAITAYDNLSGQQAYKCFACRVKKV